ncbi:hypothetical protein HIM_03350 [Hirsutella minnesotensis 3608]|uniref:EXPERA domain-containing protein n=1 Tax=Hirsutella minnesotensis 3608 TaxID=1043627 RepID=A0A0F8A6G3_9HYPO|nr:hypothetical protein HIM_03350 [Hirsutella minnesotensis 3608]
MTSVLEPPKPTTVDGVGGTSLTLFVAVASIRGIRQSSRWSGPRRTRISLRRRRFQATNQTPRRRHHWWVRWGSQQVLSSLGPIAAPSRAGSVRVRWTALPPPGGFLHIAFEGYYIVHRRRIAGLQTIPAQLWKEYALSDSRYLTSDTFTVCVETITVLVWGPLCLLAFASTVRRHRLRHALQVVVCTAHLYGCALYYATNWVEHLATGVSYSRPEWLYYWLYYVGFNLPWILVPLGERSSRAFTFPRSEWPS